MEQQEVEVKQKSWQERAYLSAARSQKPVHFVTNLIYGLLILTTLLVSFSINGDQEIYGYFAEKRAWFGRIALLVLLLVITPGILGRFNIEARITRVITLYRRRLGILVFLLALTHYHLVNLPKLVGVEPFVFPPPLFQTMGFYALLIVFFLFITSNNFSTRRLGKWWKRLHRLVYVVVLLILFHTALQRISIWSVLAGVFFVFEAVSLIYAYARGGSFFKNPTIGKTT